MLQSLNEQKGGERERERERYEGAALHYERKKP